MRESVQERACSVILPQATSASSERVFSQASLLLSKKRGSLSSGIAGHALFVKTNLAWWKEQGMSLHEAAVGERLLLQEEAALAALQALEEEEQVEGEYDG